MNEWDYYLPITNIKMWTLIFGEIVIPENFEIKKQIVWELHSIPYSAHPGIQRTIDEVRRSFYWKGILGDVRQFVENCPVCQMEKSDHIVAKGKLQSTQIPETKWSEISIDFVTDLPTSANNKDTILVTSGQGDQNGSSGAQQKEYHGNWNCPVTKWKTVIRYHVDFEGNFFIQSEPNSLQKACRNCGILQGTRLGYSIAYHPQIQGVVGMNERCGESDVVMSDSRFK